MNTVQLYSVYDIKSNLFGSPYTVQSDGVAIRSFGTACEDPQTSMNKYPSDFSLYCLGELDIETGYLTPENPRVIANASEFVTMVTADKVAEFAKSTRDQMEAVQ